MEIVLLPENKEAVSGDFCRDGQVVHLMMHGHKDLVEKIRELLTMHQILPVGKR